MIPYRWSRLKGGNLSWLAFVRLVDCSIVNTFETMIKIAQTLNNDVLIFV